MAGVKDYAEIEIIKALDEAEEIMRASIRDVFKTPYDLEITIGTMKEYKRAVKRLLGV